MKTRTISAAIMLAIMIPIFLIGGDIYNIAVLAIGLLALKEIIAIKETKKQLPVLISLISYILFTILVVFNMDHNEFVFNIDFRILSAMFLSLLLPVVMYKNNKIYSINDSFFMIGILFFLGSAFNLLILLRDMDIKYLIYLFIITILSDTYAYIGGMLIGKHKLIEEISPKKSIEGMIVGTLMGTFVATVYYYLLIGNVNNVFVLIIASIFLSLLGQFGDLVFSAIKRYYGKKDFSNLIPGHGGVLDRLDSIIFAVLGFIFVVTMI